MKPRNHSYQCPVEVAFDCIGGGVARYSDIQDKPAEDHAAHALAAASGSGRGRPHLTDTV